MSLHAPYMVDSLRCEEHRRCTRRAATHCRQTRVSMTRRKGAIETLSGKVWPMMIVMKGLRSSCHDLEESRTDARRPHCCGNPLKRQYHRCDMTYTFCRIRGCSAAYVRLSPGETLQGFHATRVNLESRFQPYHGSWSVVQIRVSLAPGELVRRRAMEFFFYFSRQG